MVDTWKTGISGNITFYNAAALLEIYEVPNEGHLQHGYYTAEFLTIGSVRLGDANSHVVPFKQLTRDGLYSLAPHLWKRGGLWIPVNDIRTGDLYKQPTTVTVKNVETAKTLAHHMSGALYLAFLIALLSLQKRETEGGAFAGAITEAYRGK